MKRKYVSYMCLLTLYFLFAAVIWNVADAAAGGPMQEQRPLVIQVTKDSWSWLKWVLGILGAVISSVCGTWFISRFFQVTKDDEDFEEQAVERRSKRRCKTDQSE